MNPIFDNNNGFMGRIIRLEDITEAQQIDKMKTEFISISSHHLRTPLYIIRGNLSMILDGDYGEVYEEVKNALKDVYHSVVNEIDLVNRMLDVSRLEMGSIQPEYEDILLNELLRDILSSYDPEIKKKDLSLDTNIEKIKIKSDKKMLREAMTNYISNAIKYNEQDGHLSIKLVKENEKIIFEVKDTGVGIPEDQEDSLFNKFFLVYWYSRRYRISSRCS
jgi:signal transduction histidine kinase